MGDEERGLLKTAALIVLGITRRTWNALDDTKEACILQGQEEWEEWMGKDKATKEDFDALSDKLSQKIDSLSKKTEAVLLKWGKKE